MSIALLVVSVLADIFESKIGAKSWYNSKKERYKILRAVDKASPLRHLKWLIKLFLTFPRSSIAIGALLIFHIMLHFVNPYAGGSVFKSPYETYVDESGQIRYHQVYKPVVLADPISDLLGYYRSGFLIVQNTFFGGKPISSESSDEIIKSIHERRFDPSKPYLISGDQFSVLYPRNLGVFYNQLLDPNTALSKSDWENRQRIYLQSVLFAIDGLSVGDKPKTTLVPVAPRVVASTTVHPGDVGSDAVYGTLFAMKQLMSGKVSDDGRYTINSKASAERILVERHDQLKHMVEAYLNTVRDTSSGLVSKDIHLSSARDGASRSSSFYDNIILWKTMTLADELGILETSDEELDRLKQKIKNQYWNEEKGYYDNDASDDSFSSDWLIGYVTGFFDLADPEDLERSRRTIEYVEKSGLADPLPIKYTHEKPLDAPWAVRTFVPSYGGEAIWSYWGSEYITLLINMAEVSGDKEYLKQAKKDIQSYEAAIVRDGGFAETFNTDGQFLQTGFYKSIRITGWVVQFEHAKHRYGEVSDSPLLGE